MKGCYCLIIRVTKKTKLKIGKLGEIEFKRGNYIYVGSAMNSLESRLNRHLRDDKKLHWHVDYLLKNQNCRIVEIIFNESDKKVECELSHFIERHAPSIKNFGCTDCKCESHLYYFKNKKSAIECVKNAYDSIAMNYDFFKI